jgi:hypothetical protein
MLENLVQKIPTRAQSNAVVSQINKMDRVGFDPMTLAFTVYLNWQLMREKFTTAHISPSPPFSKKSSLQHPRKRQAYCWHTRKDNREKEKRAGNNRLANVDNIHVWEKLITLRQCQRQLEFNHMMIAELLVSSSTNKKRRRG